LGIIQVKVPAPEPTDTEVLVRMTAAAFNQLDNQVRLGHFPMAAEPPLVLGNEGVGVVEQPGPSARWC
jgi:NADPH:quinone reductase-like Zn-dependent oxidoreductase